MKELINLENITAIEIFTPGHAETLISKIEEEVRSFVPNLKTAKTRAEIASLSAKVSKSKAVLDALGKDLVSDWKTKSRAVDVERRMIRDRLDALRDEARKPLTDWEIARQANIDAQVADIRLLEDHENAIVEDDLFNRTKEIERKELAQQKREEKQAAEREAKRIKDERVAREKLVAIKAVATAKQEADKVKAAAENKII